MTLALGICGCGGMGRRHIKGLHKLKLAGRLPFDLVAVCDLLPENGEAAAALAEERLGRRPSIHGSVEELPRLDALIITTSPETHTGVGLAAMARGMHILVEKPIALTVAQGRRLVDGARQMGRKLAVAENYRRDPINRFAKALIEAGALGTPYLYVQSASGNGERVIITPWRHLRSRGGIIVDMGIHYTDLMEFFLGPVVEVMGMNAVVDQERIDPQGNRFPVDAEDLSVGVARYRSGALVHYLLNEAGRGERFFQRLVHGTGGLLSIPRDRSGHSLRCLQRRNRADIALSDEELLALAPDYALDSVTAALFGGERLPSYTMEYPDIDANLLGVEQADFADAIIAGREPEVPGEIGLRSLALVLAFLESERLGRAVPVDELLDGAAMPYQSLVEGTPVHP
jgi:predicted dehydrogenase